MSENDHDARIFSVRPGRAWSRHGRIGTRAEMNLDNIIARFQETLNALPYDQCDNLSINATTPLDAIPWYVHHLAGSSHLFAY